MAGSFPIFDQALQQVLGWMSPRRALDIGAGAGKYGRLLQAAAPGCQTEALEVQGAFVERFGLGALYHHVHVADVTTWWPENQAAFDVVVLGECLQHLPKSAGLDLLNALVYRSAWVVVVVPEFFMQGPPGGEGPDVQRSVWSERDLHWHDLWAWDNTRTTTLALLRGYQPCALNADALVQRVNDAALMLHDFDGSSPVRPCRLRLVDHGREVAYRPR